MSEKLHQEALESGVNIKTVNGQSLVGDGNVSTAWSDINEKPSTFAPSTHKSSHATGGSDALLPSDIGAVAAVSGKGLSTNDYTTAEKTKLAGVASGATAVSVSESGTATDEVSYITVNGVEKKLSGGGDMKHSEFSGVATLSNATLNQVAAKVNELIVLLKPAVSMVMSMFGILAFGELGPTTQFGDVPPTSTLRQVVTAGGGGGGGGITTNDVNAIIASSNLCTVAAAQAMTNGISFAQLKSKPTTLDGYGITDAFKVRSYDGKDWIYVDNVCTSNGSMPNFPFGLEILSDGIGASFYVSNNGVTLVKNGTPSELNPDGSPFATLNMVESSSVTNGGAVASAKAYADATFLKTSGGSMTGSISMDFNFVNLYMNGYGLHFTGTNDNYLAFAAAVNTIENDFIFVSRDAASEVYINSRLMPDGTPVATSNMVERISKNVVNNALSGRVYDFANGSNFTKRVYTALTNVIQTLGGTVTNAPEF